MGGEGRWQSGGYLYGVGSVSGLVLGLWLCKDFVRVGARSLMYFDGSESVGWTAGGCGSLSASAIIIVVSAMLSSAVFVLSCSWRHYQLIDDTTQSPIDHAEQGLYSANSSPQQCFEHAVTMFPLCTAILYRTGGGVNHSRHGYPHHCFQSSSQDVHGVDLGRQLFISAVSLGFAWKFCSMDALRWVFNGRGRGLNEDPYLSVSLCPSLLEARLTSPPTPA